MKIPNRKGSDRIYDGYLIFISILIIFSILAPVCLHFGLDQPAKWIYLVYSFFCHQFHTRSLHIFDYQYAWCARDLGIWSGWLVGAFLVKKGFLKELRWYHMPLFIAPALLDGGIQSLDTLSNLSADGNLFGGAGYVSNNLFRFMTGSFFGIGWGGWLSMHWKRMLESGSLNNQSNVNNLANNPGNTSSEKKHKTIHFEKLRNWILPLVIVGLFIFYAMLVQLWDITSSEFEPTNMLDSVPKVQEDDFFQRRTHGACPVSGEDSLSFECF